MMFFNSIACKPLGANAAAYQGKTWQWFFCAVLQVNWHVHARGFAVTTVLAFHFYIQFYYSGIGNYLLLFCNASQVIGALRL
ncbi:MAG: hypothetical protein ACK5JF_09665 [Oscillospiraceae bacterium]